MREYHSAPRVAALLGRVGAADAADVVAAGDLANHAVVASAAAIDTGVGCSSAPSSPPDGGLRDSGPLGAGCFDSAPDDSAVHHGSAFSSVAPEDLREAGVQHTPFSTQEIASRVCRVEIVSRGKVPFEDRNWVKLSAMQRDDTLEAAYTKRLHCTFPCIPGAGAAAAAPQPLRRAAEPRGRRQC